MRTLEERRCSHCYQESVHQIKSVALIGRHAYTCSNCGGPTVECKEGCDAMARCFSLTHGDSKCAQCSGKANFVSWEEGAACIVQDTADETDPAALKAALLSRWKRAMKPEGAWEQYERASDQGMGLPFVYLCTMSCLDRVRLGVFLEIPLSTASCMGDPANEATKLLFCTRKGILPRCNHVLPQSKSWYQVLYEVTKEVFKSTELNESLSFSSSAKMCSLEGLLLCDPGKDVPVFSMEDTFAKSVQRFMESYERWFAILRDDVKCDMERRMREDPAAPDLPPTPDKLQVVSAASGPIMKCAEASSAQAVKSAQKVVSRTIARMVVTDAFMIGTSVALIVATQAFGVLLLLWNIYDVLCIFFGASRAQLVPVRYILVLQRYRCQQAEFVPECFTRTPPPANHFDVGLLESGPTDSASL
eukprot:gene3725-4137_t